MDEGANGSLRSTRSLGCSKAYLGAKKENAPSKTQHGPNRVPTMEAVGAKRAAKGNQVDESCSKIKPWSVRNVRRISVWTKVSKKDEKGETNATLFGPILIKN